MAWFALLAHFLLVGHRLQKLTFMSGSRYLICFTFEPLAPDCCFFFVYFRVIGSRTLRFYFWAVGSNIAAVLHLLTKTSA